MKHFDLSLYLVLDPDLCAGIGMVETARLAVAGGATMVQLRDKHGGTEKMVQTGLALKQVLQGTGALLIVNDDVAAAVAIGADGLHIGQEDISPAAARTLIGPDMILGLSIETEALVATIDPAIVDYAGVGPVFATPTKADHKQPTGLDGLARIIRAMPVPAVAIGGLKGEHVASVLATGASGLSVISAICGTPDPKAATEYIAEEIRKERNQKGLPMIRNVLSIAGSDPSGGAGIQADLKTFSACGVYGMAALTALTAQNTQGVTGVHFVPPDFVARQIEAVFADIRVDAVKIGMIGNDAIAEAVAGALLPHRGIPIVVDPVMIAKGGAVLLDPQAVDMLTQRLLPLATLLTPNLPEAAALLHEKVATNRNEMASQAERLRTLGPAMVLVKGGHLDGDESPDVLASASGLHWFEAKRVPTKNTHGTGCTLSSALAAELAKGNAPQKAVAIAKAYLAEAVKAAGELTIGSGHGPVQHFHALWKTVNR